jgi:hypothetical protein
MGQRFTTSLEPNVIRFRQAHSQSPRRDGDIKPIRPVLVRINNAMFLTLTLGFSNPHAQRLSRLFRGPKIDVAQLLQRLHHTESVLSHNHRLGKVIVLRA